MLKDMVQVLVDVEKFGVRSDRPRRKWGNGVSTAGRYELLEPARRRREEKFRKIKKDAGQLAVQGSSMKLRKPRRGECPRGPSMADNPRFSATALLSLVSEEARKCGGFPGDGCNDFLQGEAGDEGVQVVLIKVWRMLLTRTVTLHPQELVSRERTYA